MIDTPLFAFIGFTFCALVIFIAGKKLSYYGDLLAELTGMGKAWIGLILMSAVTSLPELMVGVSAAGFLGQADLAVGDILGSCAFNLGILSLMDVFVGKDHTLLNRASQSHVLAASFGIILIGMAGLGLFLDIDIAVTPWVGLISISFAAIYFLSMRTIFLYQQANPGVEDESGHQSPFTLKQVVIRYAGMALIIIAAALALPYFAEQIAEYSGLGKSFVGTLFLAASTSLPEIAVSIAAVRMGSVNMAVGNLLGSNIFNIFILFLDDVFYTKGNLLQDASSSNLVSVFFTILMTATVIIGLSFPNRIKRWIMAWDTLVIFLLYLLNMILLYHLSAN
jgi:cation:H+ antiporter